jgi:hypothetical protein
LNFSDAKATINTQTTPSNTQIKYLSLAYASKEACPGSADGGNFGIQYNMYCNSTFNTPQVKFNKYSDNGCVAVVDVTYKNNCNVFDINALFRWVEKYYWIVAIAMFVLGAFQWAFGQKLFKPTLFVIGTIVVLGLILFVFYAFFLPTGT